MVTCLSVASERHGFAVMLRQEQFPTMLDAVRFYLWVYVAFETFQVQHTYLYLPGRQPLWSQAVRESTWSLT